MKKVCLSFFEKHTFFSALEIQGFQPLFYIGLTEQWEKARKPLKILGKTGVMR